MYLVTILPQEKNIASQELDFFTKLDFEEKSQ